MQFNAFPVLKEQVGRHINVRESQETEIEVGVGVEHDFEEDIFGHIPKDKVFLFGNENQFESHFIQNRSLFLPVIIEVASN